MIQTQKMARLSKLPEILHRYNYEYYILNNPTISDTKYNELIKELEELEEEFPDLVDVNSPTQIVGSDMTGKFPKYKHDNPMLSLKNLYAFEEVTKFTAKLSNYGRNGIVFQYKVDGAALKLIYKEGQLFKALTRGTGVLGEDITENVRAIKSIPNILVLPKSAIQSNIKIPEYLEIIGEAYIDKISFVKLNKNRDEPFANARNAVAGSLKLKSPKKVSKRFIRFFAFDTFGGFLDYNHTEQLLAFLNIEQLPTYMVNNNSSQIDFIEETKQKRENLSYDIDGIVIKSSEYKLRQSMGDNGKYPRWAMAYKFKAEEITTKLISIDYQVGRTGIVTPVANLKPVQLAGTTIKRASLYNYDYIKSLQIDGEVIRLGDNVVIEKGGDIIPKILTISSKGENTQKIIFPTNCPECNWRLIEYEGYVGHFCINEDCPAKLKGNLKRWVSKKGMEISNLGTKTIDLLFEKGNVKYVSDLYAISISKELQKSLYDIEGLGKTSVTAFTNSLIKSLQKSYKQVIISFGIPSIGDSSAELLIKTFPNIDLLLKASMQQIESAGFNQKHSKEIRNWLNNNEQMIETLKQYNLNFKVIEKEKSTSQKLAGYSILVTGTFEGFDRNNMKDLVLENGGTIKSSVSKNVDFIVAGKNFGPAKKEKANKLDIRIINLDTFLDMIGIDM